VYPAVSPGIQIILHAEGKKKEAYGAALVSSRICRSLSSLGSGRCWRCFSREFWRTWLAGRTGAMGDSSIMESRDSCSAMIVCKRCVFFVIWV
jgi:hypothetical protein